ncbi:MAG: ester cyclase [Oleispira sp.]|nr:ester cyclase [Oleispira sp.]
MKKYVLIGLLSLLTHSATAASHAETVLSGYLNSWNSHNKIEIKSFLAPDVVWYDLATNTTIKGKEKVAPAITNYFMGYVADMYWHKNGDVYVSGNTIIYEWIYGGTFNGNWGDTKITNKAFSLKGISTTTINDDGKIIAQKDYYDMESFKRAIGVTL